MNTKNSTKRQLCCCFVEFLVFNSIHLKISVSSDAESRVQSPFGVQRKVYTWKLLSKSDDEIYSTHSSIFFVFCGLGGGRRSCEQKKQPHFTFCERKCWFFGHVGHFIILFNGRPLLNIPPQSVFKRKNG